MKLKNGSCVVLTDNRIVASSKTKMGESFKIALLLEVFWAKSENVNIYRDHCYPMIFIDYIIPQFGIFQNVLGVYVAKTHENTIVKFSRRGFVYFRTNRRKKVSNVNFQRDFANFI